MQEATNRTARPLNQCGCEPAIENRRLVIDATDCPACGRLSVSAACRATAIAALASRPAVEVRTRIDGGEYIHTDRTVGLLIAAGRFATLVKAHDETLTTRAHTDPLGAAHEAIARGGRLADLATETGLAEGAWRIRGYEAFDGGGCELNSLTSAGSTGDMLHDIDSAGELAPEDLRARYDERLRAAIKEREIETVENETGIGTVEALAAGDSPELTLEEAAEILAVSESEPDAEAIVAEMREHLLLGMTTAVLDVEAVESGIEGTLDAREIQQKIEGRLPMSLDELATIHAYIEGQKP